MDAEDLVRRLRLAAQAEEFAQAFTLTVVRCSLLRDAAREIERLRAEVKATQASGQSG